MGDPPAEEIPQSPSTSDQADDDDYNDRDHIDFGSSNCSSASSDSFYEFEGNGESVVLQEPIVAPKYYLQRPLSFSPPRASTPYTSTDLWASVITTLTFFRFAEFLSSCLGGMKSSGAAKTTLNRCAWFVSWMFEKTSSPRDESSAEVVKRLRRVLATERNYILEWIQHLETLVAPGTVANYIDSIADLVTWLTGIPLQDGEILFDGISMHKLLSNARRCERKGQLRRTLELRNYEAMLTDGRLPTGGIAELEAYVNQRMPWLHQLERNLEIYGSKYLTATIYRQFLELLFAAMYVFSPQGRPQAISKLTCSQYNELINEDCTLSREFKTRASGLGYQPVLLSQEAKTIICVYAKHIRPILHRKGAMEGSVSTSGHRMFFLTFEGREGENIIAHLIPCLCVALPSYIRVLYSGVDVSKLVKDFFLHNSPLRVSTNGVRSLTATRFADAEARGRHHRC